MTRRRTVAGGEAGILVPHSCCWFDAFASFSCRARCCWFGPWPAVAIGGSGREGARRPGLIFVHHVLVRIHWIGWLASPGILARMKSTWLPKARRNTSLRRLVVVVSVAFSASTSRPPPAPTTTTSFLLHSTPSTSSAAAMHDTPTKPHVRIRSRDAPPDDPFAFLFPHPRKHPLIIESAAAAAAAAAAHASSSTVSRPPPAAAASSRRSTDAADAPPAAKRARKESDRRTAGERVGTADGGGGGRARDAPRAVDEGGRDVPARSSRPTSGGDAGADRPRDTSAARGPPSSSRASNPRPSASISASSSMASLKPSISSSLSPSASNTAAAASALSKPSSAPPSSASAPPAPAAAAAGAPNIIHSADIVHSDLKKYTQWFLGSATSGASASSSPASPSRSDASSDTMPTVELVYLSKAYRETFSLLRPKQVVQKYAALASSSTTPPPFPAPKVAVPSDMSEYDPVADLIDTVRMLVHHTLVCPSPAIRDLFSDEPHSGAVSPRAAATPSPSSLGLLRRLERARNRRSRSEFVAAVADFNREYARCKKDGYVIGYTKKRMMAAAQDERRAIQQWLNEPTPPDLVAHVLFQAYARAVAPHADELQKYEAFSNTVYGEINPVFVELLIKTLGIKANHTFLDLGSGIGNVVLHVAARTQCHASGIEIQPAAARLAHAQLDEFRARLKYFNRRCGTVDLYEGDMLAHSAIPPLVAKADVIFVNNYVFDPKLNRALVELFLDVQEGAKIVSLKEFAPVENRITPRNVHSVEALFDVECYEYGPDYVSWTDQPGKWYVHTMNRKRVQSWLAAQGM
ncbi:hypothetical protein AMAG_14375 [Allomyces macrogynus ATCC 38327]|uniref:Histone-lysine N-methyltransferase, H3 lysine-79 specific n=1 Tax=Allomyces macrogynus (strain ATCC 38327) TaxID=578462 RepID=A0A0L0T561_ALLM3|nr:hypothetical protein AMAG_14375 [Allomyces macrogynus ATCC 38327]|eukprot:KNE69846.1 hypothetical protein AMAG_14375 [Allomyces macrogynus ATCC 38327]